MQLSFFLLLFVIATTSHAGFLIFARRHPQMSEPKRHKLWITHLWLNGIIWSVLVVWLTIIQFSLPTNLDVSFTFKWIGIALFILGITMVIAISFVLNFQNLMGLRFFYPAETKRIPSSLYRILNNPMYDGFILILVGLALWLGVVQDFYLAFASFLLLNVILASVENYEFNWNPF